jgi:hypothetical protein
MKSSQPQGSHLLKACNIIATGPKICWSHAIITPTGFFRSVEGMQSSQSQDLKTAGVMQSSHTHDLRSVRGTRSSQPLATSSETK